MKRFCVPLLLLLLLTGTSHAQSVNWTRDVYGNPPQFKQPPVYVPITPQQFGARVNDDNDDSAAFEAMFRYAEDKSRFDILIPPGEYSFANTAYLPFTTSSQWKKFNIRGYGAVLQTIADNVVIFDRSIDAVSSSPTASSQPTIEGLCFRGQGPNSTSAGTGLIWHGTSNGVFKNLAFNNLTKPIELVWCMTSSVEHCQVQGCLEGIVITNGDGLQPTLDEAGFDLTAGVETMDTDTDHGLTTGDRVQFTTSDTLPGGLALDTNYYAIVVDADTFAVATTRGTAVRVDLTSAGVDSTLNAKRIPDGTQTNSNCNVITVKHCRNQMTDAAAIGFDILCASQTRLQNCVTEGSYCDVAVRYSAASESGGVTLRDITIQNHWTEFTQALNTAFSFNLRQGSAKIDGMILTTRRGSTPDETVFISDKGSTSSVFIVSNTDFAKWNGGTDPWFVNNVPAAASRNSYSFLDNRVAVGDDWDDVGLWENAVPTALYGRTWQIDSDVLDVIP